jgi:hypothetical protein
VAGSLLSKHWCTAFGSGTCGASCCIATVHLKHALEVRAMTVRHTWQVRDTDTLHMPQSLPQQCCDSALGADTAPPAEPMRASKPHLLILTPYAFLCCNLLTGDIPAKESPRSDSSDSSTPPYSDSDAPYKKHQPPSNQNTLDTPYKGSTPSTGGKKQYSTPPAYNWQTPAAKPQPPSGFYQPPTGYQQPNSGYPHLIVGKQPGAGSYQPPPSGYGYGLPGERISTVAAAIADSSGSSSSGSSSGMQ